MSWYLPSSPNNKIDFTNAYVYDKYSNFHYYCYNTNKEVYILEYQIENKDTVHKRLEKIHYIVGSGQHTYSFVINTNGYLTEAPISYFTQSKKWDMSPGYENGNNTRFDRKIETECITCHNAFAKQVEGSTNKFENIPLGIDCERCHGAGSLHIEKIKSGDYEHNKIDYTIVNPKHLSIEQQNNLCQRCHLNGLSVLADGKTYYDHLPSDIMHTTQNVFVPNIKGSDEMIMVSHVQRMYESKCYINSGKMSCITCHNPHISYLQTPKATFNKPCIQCHTAPKTVCTETIVERKKNNDDCSQCHMSKNGSVDIPHVSITDHKIVKHIKKDTINNKLSFKGLKCYTQNKAEDKYIARAFLDYYEKIKSSNSLLDSAKKYLNNKNTKDIIRLNYLMQNHNSNIAIAPKPKDIEDAWTAYRLGEAFSTKNDLENTISYYDHAVKLMPYYLEFQQKLADAYLSKNEIAKAQKTLEYIIKENNTFYKAYNNLGLLYMNQGKLKDAEKLIQQSIKLNPKNIQALINLAVVYYQQKNIQPIKGILKRALQLEPNNMQVKAMLEDINR